MLFVVVLRYCAWRATKLALNAEITKIIALSRPVKLGFAAKIETYIHR